jgi:predicted secreted protein
MLTDGPLQVITDADRDTDYGVRVHEVFELQLKAKPTTGHVWDVVDQPDAIVVESWRWEPQLAADPYDSAESGAATYRVWRIHTTEAGTFELRLKCWQPWEGDASITDSFAVTIEAT